MNDSQPNVTEYSRILSIISSISRMSAWKALFFTDMHACFFITLYVLLVKNMFSYNTLIDILFLFGSLGLYIVYMYLINDYFDMPSDKKAGEHREIHDLPQNLVIIIILILVALSFTITILYINQIDYILIYLIAYFLATFYSAPPLRLKSKGIYGIISNILIEKSLLAFLILSFFEYYLIDALFIVFVMSLWQLELIIIHQYVDYEGDIKSNINTFVIELGMEKTLKILQYLQPIVGISYIFLSFIIIIKSPILIIFYLPLIPTFLFINNIRRTGYNNDRESMHGPPRFYAADDKIGGLRNSLSSFLGSTYEGPFPLFLALMLSIEYFPYIILVLMTVLTQYYLFKGHYSAIIRGALSLINIKKL